MSNYAGPATPRSSDVAGTLRLLAYLAISVALIVMDHRGDWLAQVRGHASVAMQPLWWLAGLPSRMGESLRDDAATRGRLAEENRVLRNELLLGAARQARLQVEAEENVFIPLRDGQRVAARIWRPVGEVGPLPAVLEYIPYRKRDLTRGRDAVNHPYLAAHGYVCVRVDLRGSGDSDGVLVDEYREQELQDAEDVIAWLADQQWCDGNVGMMGISWGGFNSLQVAARRPPALKAIVSASATEDLYVDNMHYMGGCLLGDNLSEATVMLAFNSLPPDPEIVGDAWRQMWLERLRGSGLWLDTWLSHQRRDEYWRPASVSEDYSAIQCPVLAVGGWADGYTNAIFRLLEHLEVPCHGLIGPWGHKYPHIGVPGPPIGRGGSFERSTVGSVTCSTGPEATTTGATGRCCQSRMHCETYCGSVRSARPNRSPSSSRDQYSPVNTGYRLPFTRSNSTARGKRAEVMPA